MYSEIFKKRLKEARKKRAYTQAEVALELNIPRVNITNYETGRTQPDIDTLGRLADLYEVSADWLLGTGIKKTP